MYHTRLCAKHMHCELWVGGVCFPRPGRFCFVLLAANRRAGRAASVPGACVRSKGWSHTSTPLLHSVCAQARAARRGAEALERMGKGTATLAPVPGPGGWQGVCHQCWPEDGRATVWAEVGAELDTESTQSTKRIGNKEHELMARMIQVENCQLGLMQRQ